jgi:lactoylglutathione lyase
MLRVRNLERSLSFYTQQLGMRLLRREEYPEGKFTLAFIGYGDERADTVIELTYNWDRDAYEHGTAFGHIALAVNDIEKVCHELQRADVKIVRPPGPMKSVSPDRSEPEIIAFIEDPDGYRIELIEVAKC